MNKRGAITIELVEIKRIMRQYNEHEIDEMEKFLERYKLPKYM